jgi:hypothetical protein
MTKETITTGGKLLDQYKEAIGDLTAVLDKNEESKHPDLSIVASSYSDTLRLWKKVNRVYLFELVRYHPEKVDEIQHFADVITLGNEQFSRAKRLCAPSNYILEQ